MFVTANTATDQQLQDAPIKRSRLASLPTAAEKRMALIRNLIWLYIFLWLIEGGLRRWFLPGLSTPLLVVRDPIAIAIYFLASSNRIFPSTFFIGTGIFLGLLSFVNAVCIGHGNALVAIYGVRCDFLHVPLIFIMGKVLRQSDIIKLAKVAMWVAPPYTLLLIAQFYEPQSAWVNRGVGGDMTGAGFTGALDHFRPPGTFSFISGPAQLYPLFTACWFMLLLLRKLPFLMMAAAGGAILIAIPISISRDFFLTVSIVATAGIFAMVAGGRFSMKIVFQFAFAAALIVWLAGKSTAFQDGMSAFNSRWQTATVDAGGFKEAIVDRVIDSLIGSQGVTATGLGTGFSTNVGQVALTTKYGFGASESEWGRLLFDNGYVLGTMIIIYRVSLTVFIFLTGMRAWRRRSPVALLFCAACMPLVFNGPWGQSTTLGSAVIGSGLALAAATNFKPDAAKKRKLRPARETLQ
jgi:hypothetical protein